ncbi:hypothetical protein DPV78_005074 [Talaromyces pinophilus]|nr:hypothetical protein DPV78_005074 [Talaromyces pinophilus]
MPSSSVSRNALGQPFSGRQDQSTRIPRSSLRVQRAVWLSAGGGIIATLEGVYLMMRSFRRLRHL